MKQVSKIFLSILFAGGFSGVMAQNNNSPTSIIGIGDLENGYMDRSSGMANAGVSLSSGRFMYHANPASYSRLDDHFFAIEMTGRFKAVSYSGTPITTSTGSSTDLQVAKLAMAVKVKKWWGVSLGLLPYSTSNYSLYTTKGVTGDLEYNMPAYYQGSGGLHKVYFANAVNISKKLSVGLEASYIWGSMQQEETLDASSLTGTTITTTAQDYYHGALFKVGAQYNTQLTKKWKLNLGAAASNKTRLSKGTFITVLNGTTSVVTDDRTANDQSFYIPVNYTAGGSLVYNNKLTIAYDYNRQNWQDLGYSGLSYHLVNADRHSAGVEYSSKRPLYSNTNDYMYEKYFLQAGLFYSHSYLQMYNQHLKNYGVTIGAGLNTKSPLSYQVSMELGINGTTSNNLVKQNYTMVNFTVMYRDFWFTKVKKYN